MIVSKLREALLAFAGATVAAALLYQLARVSSFINGNLQALIGVVFLFIPVLIAGRRDDELTRFGFTWRPLGRSLLYAAAVLAIVFPLFLFGFHLYYSAVCAWQVDVLAPRALCARYGGLAALAHPRPPLDFLGSAFSQLIVVALPEELFFRGYLLHRLEGVWPPGKRLLGGGVGRALFVSALLFALGHVLVDFNPRRLAVFFPGLLFGWLRSASGGIVAGTLVHAAANLYIEALHRTFFSWP